MYGGEEDVRRNEDGSIFMGGRPNCAEAASTEVGKDWRNLHRDKIRNQGLVRPSTNWYRVNNRLFDH